MLIRRPNDVRSSDITPETLYVRRRELMSGGLALAAATALGLESRRALGATPAAAPLTELTIAKRQELAGGEEKTPFEDVTHYNNFYEFGTGKTDPAQNAHTLKARPWTLACAGEVAKPQTLDLDQLYKLFPLEERVYRLRCVEAWSMVIPWVGFPLASLLGRLEPTSKAKFVAFETLRRPDEMPGQKRDTLAWPYVEGLRLDEAMHPLTLVAVGLYGRTLPNQNGAPVRLVVPWKYGFKSIKSVVRISLVDRQPTTTWNRMGPDEFGFYSNVNPAVDHPRWSQKKERRIGEWLKRRTLPFNGYADQVAGLYAGMDLAKNF